MLFVLLLFQVVIRGIEGWNSDAGLIPTYAHIPGASLWASTTDSM